MYFAYIYIHLFCLPLFVCVFSLINRVGVFRLPYFCSDFFISIDIGFSVRVFPFIRVVRVFHMFTSVIVFPFLTSGRVFVLPL